MASSSTDVLRRAQSRVGTVLNGKWHLDEVLGVGGMATVYAATHRNRKRVAIKMLHSELSFDENVRGRFLREGYAANTVGHPGAVTVFDDNVTEDGSAFLVMELLEGETAHARLLREGAFPLEDALPLGEDVLDVLAAAHQKGIVHRDLKPENLYLTAAGVRLLDFGIARLRELPMGTGISANGLFMGTPAFMSPEHARGKWSEVDAQSDIWSVGATLFTLLTGKFVHESETAVDTLVLAVTQAPRPIRSLVERIPQPVAAVIDRALYYNKEDRWDSARSMQVALRTARLSLRPEELVLRGGQREGPERAPSTPSGHVNATVRSSGGPFSPRSGAPFSPRSGPSVSPHGEDARKIAAAAGSLEPVDSLRAPSSIALGRRETSRRGWLLLGIALATLVSIGVAVFGRGPWKTQSAATTAVERPQVLVPSASQVAPSPPAASPDTRETSNATPDQKAVAPPVSSAQPAPLPAEGATLHPPVRRDRRAPASTAKAASSVWMLAPGEPSAETAKPSPHENPFDRRF